MTLSWPRLRRSSTEDSPKEEVPHALFPAQLATLNHLPDIIDQSEVAEKEYLIDLVRNLMKECVRADKCINLLAILTINDPANSSTSKLIEKVKEEARAPL